MKSIYNIYFTSSKLEITDSPEENNTYSSSLQEITSAQELCRMLSIHKHILLVTPSPAEAFEQIASLFKKVTAAGGIVKNSNNDSLMIYRNRRWDLPKGHWEAGETIEECAMREVEEETGVGELTIQKPICTTTHIYNMRGQWEIKTTHWFLMTSTHSATLAPQREEGIEEVRWCSTQDIKGFANESYPTIQKVLHEAKVL